MNLNATIRGADARSSRTRVWFTMKFVWPMITGADRRSGSRRSPKAWRPPSAASKDLAAGECACRGTVARRAQARAGRSNTRRRRGPTRSSRPPSRPRRAKARACSRARARRSRSRRRRRAMSCAARWRRSPCAARRRSSSARSIRARTRSCSTSWPIGALSAPWPNGSPSPDPTPRPCSSWRAARSACRSGPRPCAAAASVVADPRVDGAARQSRRVSADAAGRAGHRRRRRDASTSTARNFIATLAANRRLGLLPEIAARYEQLRAEAERTRRCRR